MKMDEYISKTKFEELMRKKARSNFDLYYVSKSKHYRDCALGYNMAADDAHDFPSEDVQPVKRGKWKVDTKLGSDIKVCTNCHNEAYWDTDYGQQLFDYCPYCGARMDGDIE
jgi:hypothetical protein